jgi:diguanylate cyclase (GGDEF)-like protein
MKVIIADDDATTRCLLENTMEKWNYDVLSTTNGLEALDALLKQDESCMVLLDWIMPEIDGIDVCRIIRERQKEQAYIYIIMLTGKQKQEDVITGLDAGADDFLVKPFDYEELRMRMRVGQRILQLQDQLTEKAYYDQLTAIYNRMAILDILKREFSRSKRSNQPLSIIMVDLDHFKNVNDTYGHLGGDVVLKGAASCMKDAIRTYDSIGRYGGEEFLIVVPGSGQNETSKLAKRIQDNLADSAFEYNDQQISITISMGISDNCTIGIKDIDSLIRVADEALYQAKDDGRDCFVIADNETS